MKRVADCSETVVVVPLVAPPIEVQVALFGVPVEVRDVAVVVQVLPHGTNVRNIASATALRMFSGLYRIRDLVNPNPLIFRTK